MLASLVSCSIVSNLRFPRSSTPNRPLCWAAEGHLANASVDQLFASSLALWCYLAIDCDSNPHGRSIQWSPYFNPTFPTMITLSYLLMAESSPSGYPAFSNICRISVVIRPVGDASSFMTVKWSAPGISS